MHACQSHEGAVLEGSLLKGCQLPFVAEFRPMPRLWVQPPIWSWGSDSEGDGGRVPSGTGGSSFEGDRGGGPVWSWVSSFEGDGEGVPSSAGDLASKGTEEGVLSQE